MKRAMKRGDLVWFMWRGFLCVSPVLRLNRVTVTVATSAGERRIQKARVSLNSKGVR